MRLEMLPHTRKINVTEYKSSSTRGFRKIISLYKRDSINDKIKKALRPGDSLYVIHKNKMIYKTRSKFFETQL